jgi:hypothetical protein
VKAALRDANAGAVGSVTYDLDVPDFDKLPLAMSGVVLTSISAGRYVVAKDDASIHAVLPAPPITERSFPQGSEVWAFAEVYDNLGGASHLTEIATTLTSESGAVVYHVTSDHDPREFHGQHGTFRYRIRVPLTDAGPGAYVIAIEARTKGDSTAGAKREVPITVMPAKAH